MVSSLKLLYLNFVTFHKPMKRLLLVSPLLFISLLGFSQSQADSLFIKKMSDEILRNGKAYDLLYELTKKIGGRLAGSPQQQNAVI